jgi:hypothetical protein
MLNLTDRDAGLIKVVRAAIHTALSSADNRTLLAKRIAVEATKQRNRGRASAVRRHPFQGVCEASNQPLDHRDAVLDELEPEKGYAGKVRWVCPKANNSGRRSCGAC